MCTVFRQILYKHKVLKFNSEAVNLQQIISEIKEDELMKNKNLFKIFRLKLQCKNSKMHFFSKTAPQRTNKGKNAYLTY